MRPAAQAPQAGKAHDQKPQRHSDDRTIDGGETSAEQPAPVDRLGLKRLTCGNGREIPFLGVRGGRHGKDGLRDGPRNRFRSGIERNVEGRNDNGEKQGCHQIAAAGAERDPAYQQQTVKCQQDATAKERFDEV